MNIKLVAAKELFDLDIDMELPIFDIKNEHVPTIDQNYCFDRETLMSILVGFKYNMKVMI